MGQSQARRAAHDVLESFRATRLWLFLGWNDISRQYRRSFVGPIWLSVSTAIFIGAFGFVWSQVFGVPVEDYLPYVATGHIVYTLINTMVVDSASVFTVGDALIKQIPTPKFIFPLRLVFRNFVIFIHNFLVILAVLWYYDRLSGVNVSSFLLGLSLLLLNGVLVSTYLGLLCTRFRDVPLIVTNTMQVMFFVTPVLWNVNQISLEAQFIVQYNPVANFLIIARDPLLGSSVPESYYFSAFWMTAVNLVLASYFFILFRRKIVFWL